MNLFPRLPRRCCVLMLGACRWSSVPMIASWWDTWGARGFWLPVYGDCMTSMCGSQGGSRASRDQRRTLSEIEVHVEGHIESQIAATQLRLMQSRTTGSQGPRALLL